MVVTWSCPQPTQSAFEIAGNVGVVLGYGGKAAGKLCFSSSTASVFVLVFWTQSIQFWPGALPETESMETAVGVVIIDEGDLDPVLNVSFSQPRH